MLNLISVVVAIVSAVAPAVPNNYHAVNIAEAKTNSLAYSVLEVKEIPHPPEKSFISEEKGEEVAEDEDEIKTTPEGIVELIKENFGVDGDVMLEVARCESGLLQYENGKVLKGKTTPDFGLFQINEIWLLKAEAMGIDIYDLEGNIKMARYIYDTQGLSAWSASAFCWLKMGDIAN